MINKLLPCIALCLMLSPVLGAQTKNETKQYGKAVASGTVKAYEKFIFKYPNSVYAADVRARLDTLLHISPYSPADATAAIRSKMPEGSSYKAFGWRNDGKDMIVVLCTAADSLKSHQLRVCEFEKKGENWNAVSSVDYPCGGDFSQRQLLDLAEEETFNGKRAFSIWTLCSESENSGMESLDLLVYYPHSLRIDKMSFLGSRRRDGKLEGRLTYMAETLEKNSEEPMKDKFIANPELVFLSEGDYLCDETIHFWLSSNPDALSTASRINAVKLDEKNSLTAQFNSIKKKNLSSAYAAAMFDFRGYTVIVAKNRKDGTLFLAWAEPECTDAKSQRLLNSISFKNATTVEMFYYHGSRAFKYYLNLASKTLRR